MLRLGRKKDLASYARYLLLKMRGYSKARMKKYKQSIYPS
jgi:hypothetical protein|tara:strand:- start:496 stop:615 length:120 start_codon:yes stop_codon:yes gene_type:complete